MVLSALVHVGASVCERASARVYVSVVVYRLLLFIVVDVLITYLYIQENSFASQAY